MTVSAQKIAAALDAKSAGDRKWKAHCPAHEDKNPSFSISESSTGKVLVKCWAGCTQEEVIEALHARGLWHEHKDQPSPLRPVGVEPKFLRPTPLQQMLELERLLADAEYASAEAPYIVIGQILEDAARMTYNCVVRVSAELNEHGPESQRHVARWLNERYPDALFELPA